MRSTGYRAFAWLLAGIVGGASAGCSTGTSAPSSTEDAGSGDGEVSLDGGAPPSDAAPDGGRGDEACQTKARSACASTR